MCIRCPSCADLKVTYKGGEVTQDSSFLNDSIHLSCIPSGKGLVLVKAFTGL